MSCYPFIVAEHENISFATVHIPGRTLTADSTHPNFDDIVEYLYSDDHDVDELIDLFDIVSAIGVAREDGTGASSGNIVFDPVSGNLTYNGHRLSGDVVDRLFTLHNQGLDAPAQKLLKFIENLYQNPSKRVIDRLYTFLEKGGMPTTDDGYFLAYKKVRDNYTDVHTGTFDNSVGAVLDMPRALVDDRDENTCSTGFHFCSHSYLQSFGGSRVMVVKINPADVVSIPVDYNDAKGRACKYTVVDEITEKVATGPVWDSKVDPIVNHYKKLDEAPVVVADPVWPMPVNSASSSSLTIKTPTERLSKVSNSNLARIWNILAGPFNSIDHFRDKATGIKRLSSMFTFAEIEQAAESIGLSI